MDKASGKRTGLTLNAGDIEIGAVEIKDGAADIRQTVLAASTAAAAADKAAVVALHPSSTAMNAGAASAITTRTVTATDSPDAAVLGTTAGAAVVTDANGTIQQYLRGLVKLFGGGAGAGASIVSSVAYEASHVLKASAGTLMSLVGYNSKASAQWIQIYNSATVPADTAVPIYTFLVQATSNFSLDVPIVGIPFTTGISVANSSTGPTKTLGSADCWFTAVIK